MLPYRKPAPERRHHIAVRAILRQARDAVVVAATAVISAIVLAASFALPSFAQGASAPSADRNQRVVIKFATTADYPPFNARDEDGVLVGFNVDLARAICLGLDVTCEVTSRPWEQLFPRLDSGDADAVIAAHRINVETLAKADFTRPYFYTPGRFVARRDGPALTISPRGLDRVRIGVAEGTAHEAFIQTFFRTSRVVRFKTPEAARTALSERAVDAIFGDGISLTFWINGSLSGGCCDLAGGPYLEPIFFGDGIGIAVKRGNRALLTDLNDAIEALQANGRMLELLQRYFPRQIF